MRWTFLLNMDLSSSLASTPILLSLWIRKHKQLCEIWHLWHMTYFKYSCKLRGLSTRGTDGCNNYFLQSNFKYQNAECADKVNSTWTYPILEPFFPTRILRWLSLWVIKCCSILIEPSRNSFQSINRWSIPYGISCNINQAYCDNT